MSKTLDPKLVHVAADLLNSAVRSVTEAGWTPVEHEYPFGFWKHPETGETYTLPDALRIVLQGQAKPPARQEKRR